MSMESSRTLCLAGMILMVVSPLLGVGVIAAVSGVLGLVGLILTLVGLKGLADGYRDQGIFNNVLYAFILMVIGTAVLVVLMVLTMLSWLASVGIDLMNIGTWANFGMALGSYFGSPANMGAFIGLLGVILFSWVVFVVFVIVATILIRRSLTSLAKKSGVKLFESAGIVMLIGGVLTIIFVGALLIWVAFLLAAIAFYQMKAK